MKKKTALLLALLLLLGSLCGCGSAAKSESPAAAQDSYSMTEEAVMPAEEPAAPMPEAGSSGEASASDIGTHVTDAQSQSDKIIYSANAQVETLDFDGTLEKLYAVIDGCGGFLESSSIYGTDYYSAARGYNSGRSASFTIRVPRASFVAVTNGLSELGNVPYISTDAQNITQQYTDTASRLSSYQTQEERLLDMLGKAETVEDMLEIEARLAEVRYEIEALTTTINSWDSLINYSTLILQITEVEEYTPTTAVSRSYWQQISDGLAETLMDVGRFFKNLFKDVVIALPVLLILAVLALIVILIIRRVIKKRRAAAPRAPRSRRGRAIAPPPAAPETQDGQEKQEE